VLVENYQFDFLNTKKERLLMRQYSVSPTARLWNMDDKSLERDLYDYNIKIKHDPSNHELYLKRATVNEMMGAYSCAAKDLTCAMNLDPEKKRFYLYRRYQQYMLKGNFKNALEDILEAISLAPDESYLEAHAYVYKQMGQIDKAIEVLSEGIKKAPEKRYLYLYRAAFYEGIGCFQEAISDVTHAINMSQTPWIYYHDRVSIYLKSKQYDEALNDCNKCIESNPKDWTHYRMRSEVYEAMGKKDHANSDYQMSLEYNPSIVR